MVRGVYMWIKRIEMFLGGSVCFLFFLELELLGSNYFFMFCFVISIGFFELFFSFGDEVVIFCLGFIGFCFFFD